MSTPHAPGPWEIATAITLDPSTKCKFVSIRDSLGLIIARVWHPRTIDQGPATATLIKTAPDLLALAHQYAEECGDCAGTRIVPDGKGGDEPCDACTDIWQVIDKAEGRS